MNTRAWQRWCLWAVMIGAPLFFFTDMTRIPYMIQGTLSRSALAVLVALWLAEAIRNGKVEAPRTEADRPLWLWLGFGLFTLVLAIIRKPEWALAMVLMGGEGVIYVVLNALMLFHAYLYLLRTEKDRDRAVGLFFWVGVVAAVYGILQSSGVEPIWPRTINPFGGRAVSTFGNPNFLASYLAVAIPLSAVKYVDAGTPARRVIYGLLNLVLLGALLCTGTRSGWLGTLVGLAVVTAFLWRGGAREELGRLFKGVVMVAAAALIGVMLLPGPRKVIIERTKSIGVSFEKAGQPLSQRVLIWRCTKDMIMEHPIVGQGFNLFELVYPWKQPPYLPQPEYRPFRTHGNAGHNEILCTWAETGIIGVGLFLWFLVIWTRKSVAVSDNLPPGPSQRLVYGAVGGAAGFCVDQLFNVSFHFPGPSVAFWLAIALVFLQERLVQKRAESKKSAVVVPAIAWPVWECPQGWKRALLGLGILACGLVVVKEVCQFMGSVHFIYARRYGSSSMPEKAVEQFRISAAWDPSCVHTHYEGGNALMASDKYEEAIEWYKTAWRVNPGYDEISFNMGLAYQSLKRFPEAIEWLNRSLYVNPLNEPAWLTLGSIYNEKKDWPEAERVYRRSLELFPKDKDGWNNLGFVLSQEGRTADAVEAYRQALGLDPTFDVARNNLYAMRYKTLGSKGMASLRQQIQDHLEKGRKFAEARKFEAAEAEFRAAVDLDPSGPIPHLYLGNVAFQQEHFDDAREQFLLASRLDPRSPGTLKNLGLTYLKLNRPAEALRAFEAVLRAEPGDGQLRAEVERLRASIRQ